MATSYVKLTQQINAPREQVFEWFYHSENFVASPIVFKSKWLTPKKWEPGATREIVMIAGRYLEEITAVKTERYIRYRVQNSFPKVRQEFTEISFEQLTLNSTKVTWIIELEPLVLVGKSLASRIGEKMAKTLYNTIILACKKALE